MVTLFLMALILIILAFPIWPYSKKWGYKPAAAFAILAIFLLILILKDVVYLEIQSENGKTEIQVERNTKK